MLGARAQPLTVSRTASLKNAFPAPISFDSAKRNGVGPPKKSADWPFDVSFYDRRTKTGHTLPPAPLPLMPTKAIPAAAHGRAPDASLRCDQACPEGPADYHNRQQSGSGNQGQGASDYPNAGKRPLHYHILGPRKNGGPGVQVLGTRARPWRSKSLRAKPPAHLCLLSVRTESRSPSGET